MSNSELISTSTSLADGALVEVLPDNVVVFTEMLNKTIVLIEGATIHSDSMTLHDEDGRQFRFYHSQQCCERVEIEDIVGDINDITFAPIFQAECVSDEAEENDGSTTWTFYKFSTQKGTVTIRWLGRSNGCYSEKVDYKCSSPAGLVEVSRW